MMKAFIPMLALVPTIAVAEEGEGTTYSINDFKTKLFWKRPPQGK